MKAGRPESIDWKRFGPLAGKISDQSLARVISDATRKRCSGVAVLKYRRRNNIAPFQKKWGR